MPLRNTQHAATPNPATQNPVAKNSVTKNPVRRPRAWTVVLAVAVTVLAWASAFVTVRGVRDVFEPGAIALGRLLVGSVALGAAVMIRGAWIRPTRREFGLVAVCGISWFAVYNVALNTAERHVDAGTAAMLVNVGPILIALLAGAFLGEGFPRWLLIGAGVAFCGVVVIAIASSHSSSGGGVDVAGLMLSLVAAMTWAIGVTAQKKALRRLPPLQVTQMSCTIGAIVCLPFAGDLLHGVAHAHVSSVAAVVYLGVVPTALGFGTWAYALSRTTAGRLGVTTYLVPPLTILLSWPVLRETPTTMAMLGGLLALGGIALSRRR